MCFEGFTEDDGPSERQSRQPRAVAGIYVVPEKHIIRLFLVFGLIDEKRQRRSDYFLSSNFTLVLNPLPFLSPVISTSSPTPNF